MCSVECLGVSVWELRFRVYRLGLRIAEGLSVYRPGLTVTEGLSV